MIVFDKVCRFCLANLYVPNTEYDSFSDCIFESLFYLNSCGSSIIVQDRNGKIHLYILVPYPEWADCLASAIAVCSCDNCSSKLLHTRHWQRRVMNTSTVKLKLADTSLPITSAVERGLTRTMALSIMKCRVPNDFFFFNRLTQQLLFSIVI